jgi:hypothetical protein
MGINSKIFVKKYPKKVGIWYILWRFYEGNINKLLETQNIHVNHYLLGISFVKMKQYRL